MAMSVGSPDDGEDQMNSTINTTPLVDVMLVLLIIFLITIPVVTQSVPLELPKERNVPTQTKPENIVIAVDRDGDVYWNMERLPDSKRWSTGSRKRACSTRNRKCTSAGTSRFAMNPWVAWWWPVSAPAS